MNLEFVSLICMKGTESPKARTRLSFLMYVVLTAAVCTRDVVTSIFCR